MNSVRNIDKLVEFFSAFTVTPVDPDDVKDQILSYGTKDEISFVGVTLDTRIIYGAFHQHIFRNIVYGEPKVCVDIYYDRSLTRDWKRLVCCKELLHVLDHSVSRTTTKEECENLVEHIVEINGGSPFSEEKLQAFTDALMTYYAIAVLFPWGVREILYPDFVAGRIGIDKIKDAIDLPEFAVRLVMSERWPIVYQAVSKR